jgi:excisionase family DNA binding protein
MLVTGGEAGGVPAEGIGAAMAATPFDSQGPDRSESSGPGDMSDVQFLTVAEVATMMRVSKMTVYRLVHSGELPAVRVGRSFRVVERDVNEYLRKSFYNAG